MFKRRLLIHVHASRYLFFPRYSYWSLEHVETAI